MLVFWVLHDFVGVAFSRIKSLPTTMSSFAQPYNIHVGVGLEILQC